MNKPWFWLQYFWSIVNDINSIDSIGSSIKANLSILVTNLLSFILFVISDSTSFFGYDGYMSLISELTSCSSSLNFSSFMFSTKLFESLIKLFPDAVICCNCFDKVFLFYVLQNDWLISVDYKAFDITDITNIHKYLMKNMI